jgi:tetratricopeptide (TPR) repeat protein
VGAIPLSGMSDLIYEARLTLPEGFTPTVPAPVYESTSFARYESTYKLSGSLLEGTRHLLVLQQIVPPGDRHSYIGLNKAITNEETKWIALSTNELPVRYQSSNPDVQKLLSEAYDSLQSGAPHAAVASIEQAAKLDPKAANTWFVLGTARATDHQYHPAITAFRKAIELDPSDIDIYAAMASLHWANGNAADAAQAWRDCLKIAPNNLNANRALASILINKQDFAGARPLLEKLSDKNYKPPVTFDLAQTYLHVGEQEKGMRLLQEFLHAQPNGETMNSVAWALSEAKYRLPDALNFARESVRQVEEQTVSDPGRLGPLMYDLVARWDTLGWVYFQMGDLDEAERFLSAAWKLWPSAETGAHLGDVYEKKGDAAQAKHMYSLAMATLNPNQFGPVRDKLVAKIGSAATDARSTELLQKRRTFTVNYPVESEKSAQFLLILAKNAKVNQIDFVSGDESLRQVLPKLYELKFDLEFPDNTRTHLYQSATLHCSAVRHDCTFVLFEPPAKELSQVLQAQSSSTIN